MRFKNNAFWWGGLYGILLAIGFFLMEKRFAPGLTHPEYYYAFAGALLVWHLLYLYIANHREECRAIMPFAVLEKISFAVPVLVLYAMGRVTWLVIVGGALGDLVWGALFLMTYIKLGSAGVSPATAGRPRPAA